MKSSLLRSALMLAALALAVAAGLGVGCLARAEPGSAHDMRAR